MPGLWRSFLVRLGFGLQTALGGLASHRLRSAITIVGVTIGVASVVSLVAIGEGARLVIVRQFQSLGTNLIKIESHHWRADLRPQDAVELEARVPTIDMAMPVVKADAQVKWRRVRSEAKILGVTEDFPRLREHPVAAGHFFTHLHVTHRLRVAVVGYNVVDSLFQGRNPIGQRFYIGTQRFTVIGVLARKGAGMADDIDDKIVIPVTAAQRLTRSYRVNEVWVKAVNKDTVDAAVAQISRIYRKKFHIQEAESAEGEKGRPGVPPEVMLKKGGRVYMARPAPYQAPVRMEMPRPPGAPEEDEQRKEQSSVILTVTSLNELVQEASKANRVMTLMLGAIAGVSLLVGGLGIMNIMLVSVTERTAEIGLRKALGARRSDLILQFLLEAFLLSVFGGLLGVALGWVGTGVIQRYGIEAAMTWGASWAALLAALLVGLVFGVYPAYQASGLSPAEALRK